MVDDWKTAGDIALKLTVDPEPGYAVKECFFTYNAGTNNLYVILPKIPASKTFTIKNLMLNPGTRVEFLEGKKVIGWTQQGTDIILQLPELPLDHFKTNYSYVIKISNTGRFAANPALHITYPRQTRNPLVTITTRDKDATVRYTLDNTEPSEQSILYTNPITVAKAGLLKAIAYKNGALPSSVIHHELVIYDWQPAIKKSDIKPALAYHAYELKTTTVEHMLDGINPVKEGTATNFSVNHSTRKENSALRYEGYIRIPEDGIYSFHLASDDGSMLWIDGKTVVNNDGLHGNDEKAGAVALKKGLHQLRMDYFNASGDAALKLQWSRDGSMKSTIPADWLFH